MTKTPMTAQLIGGPTLAGEIGGLRIITGPTFDVPRNYPVMFEADVVQLLYEPRTRTFVVAADAWAGGWAWHAVARDLEQRAVAAPPAADRLLRDRISATDSAVPPLAVSCPVLPKLRRSDK